MSQYFHGLAHDLGQVSALPQPTFSTLCAEVLIPGVRLPQTRDEFFALPKKDKAAPLDQARAKRVTYVTPACFDGDVSRRTTEQATRCNLIALDIDNSDEARRLLTQRWGDCFRGLAYIVWHTVSSTEENPRLRVIVSADGIPAARYSAAVQTVAEMIGLTQVTHESRVVVQPMFIPTLFADSAEAPIIAAEPEGDAFTVADILTGDDSSFASDQRPVDDQLGDLAFLRAPLENITLEDAKSALLSLDPDMGMQPWIETAAALKHQFDSSEAYALWDEWSSKGKKYESSEETKYRWDSLRANPTDRAPVTIRSLFKTAQARGWTNAALTARQTAEVGTWLKSGLRSSEQLLDEGAKRIAKVGPLIGQLERKVLIMTMAAALKTRGTPLPVPDITKAVRTLERDAVRQQGVYPWAKGLCFVTSANLFYRHTTDRRFAPEVLDLMYQLPTVGEDKVTLPRHYAIQTAEVPQVESLRYEPAQGNNRYFSEDGVPYCNTYRADYAATDPLRADEAGEVYQDHLSKLVAEPAHRRTLTDYFAYLVQHPGKKIRWTPLIQGGEGCGKSTLAEMMRAVLGRRNVSKLNAKDVMDSQYNDWAYGTQLVVLEEVRVIGSNRHAVMDKLKPCITDDFIGLNCKFEPKRTVPNVTNYIMFTNYHDSLATREDGRRYFVLSSPLQRPEQIAAIGGKAHFDQLYSMIRDNPGGLRAFFESWPISKDFDPEGRAPVTRYLKELAENAASPLTQAVKFCIEDQPHPLVRTDLLSLACLRGSLDTAHLKDFSDQALAAVLRELGWEKYERVMIEGAKHQLWTRDYRGNNPRQDAALRLEFL
jgi:hypothetical protein